MNQSHHSIEQFLARARHEAVRLSFVQSICILMIFATASVLCAGELAALIRPAVGWAVFLAGLCVGCVLAVVEWRRLMASFRSNETAARWVQARVAGLKDGLITSVQLAHILDDQKDDAPRYPRGLIEATLRQTAALLESCEPESLPDRQRFKRLAVTLCLIGSAGLLMGALDGPRLERGFRAMIDGEPPSVSEVTGRNVLPEAVRDMTIKITSPRHTGLKPRIIDGTGGHFSAISGASVVLSGVPVKRLSRAMLILESDPDGRWPVNVSDDGRIVAELRVGESDRYRFSLVLDDQTLLDETRWRTVTVIPDEAPQVRLRLPDADLEVRSNDMVPILAESFDDFGLDSIALVIEADEAAPVRIPLGQGNGLKSHRASYSIEVKRLGLQPGESVNIYVEAADRNRVTGPGKGQSNRRRIALYSPDKERARILQLVETLIDDMVELLADRLESPIEARQSRHLGNYVKVHSAIVGRSALALSRLAQILQALTVDSSSRDEFRKVVSDLLDRLQELQNQESALLEKIVRGDAVSPRPRVAVSLLGTINDDGVKEIEKGVFSLKNLVERSRQDDILDKGRELLNLHGELAKLLEQFKASGDRTLLKGFNKQLSRLEQNLGKMEQQLLKLADRVPYENQNPVDHPSTTQLDMRDMRSDLRRVRELIREGKIAEAMKLLESLNTKTQQLMAGLQDQFKTGRPLNREGQNAMSKLQRSLDQVVERQAGLMKDTGALRKELESQLKAKFNETSKELILKAEAIRKQLKDVVGKDLGKQDRGALKGLREVADQLKSFLEKAVFADAEQRAGKVLRESTALAGEVKLTEEREMDAGRVANQRSAIVRFGTTATLAQELIDALKKLSKKMARQGGGGSSSQRQQLKRIGKAQGSLGDRVDDLHEALERLEKKVPGIQRRLEKALKGARSEMGSAEKKLGKGLPAEAAQHQDEALRRLNRTRKQLQKQMKRQKNSRGQMSTGPNDPRERVGIPKEDAGGLPKAYRDRLLKVMKELAPKRFRHEIKRYYEELLK